MGMKRRDVLKGAAATAAVVAGGAAILTPKPSYAQQVDAAKKWVDSEFQPSTLSKEHGGQGRQRPRPSRSRLSTAGDRMTVRKSSGAAAVTPNPRNRFLPSGNGS